MAGIGLRAALMGAIVRRRAALTMPTGLRRAALSVMIDRRPGSTIRMTVRRAAIIRMIGRAVSLIAPMVRPAVLRIVVTALPSVSAAGMTVRRMGIGRSMATVRLSRKPTARRTRAIVRRSRSRSGIGLLTSNLPVMAGI